MEVLYSHCAGLDVHQQTVVACARVASGSTVQHEVRTFGTMTGDLLALADWLTAQRTACTAAVAADMACARSSLRANSRQRAPDP